MLELEEQNRTENLAGKDKDPPQENNHDDSLIVHKKIDDNIDEVLESIGGFGKYQWL